MLEVSYPTEHAEYHLTHALLFYHSGNTTMATVHKVQNRQLLAGKSISIADVEELFHSENQHQKMQFLPPYMPSEPHGEGDIAVELWKKLEPGEK